MGGLFSFFSRTQPAPVVTSASAKAEQMIETRDGQKVVLRHRPTTLSSAFEAELKAQDAHTNII